MVSGINKLDALTRILEAEPYDGMLIFSRTKLGTQELAEKLAARGLSAAAIHGDVEQKQREKMVQSLKDGRIDILVATDVAARGLDVERISHVLNYDIPTDTEAYVHRIGRTGRAGRSGEAILFVAPREKRMLQAIERATRQPIAEMQLPSVEAVNDQRITKFKQRIVDALGGDDLGPFRQLIESFEQERNVPAVEIAAALARLVQGKEPLLLQAAARFERTPPFERDTRAFERPAREGRFEKPPGRVQRDERPQADMHQRAPSAPRRESTFAAPAASHVRQESHAPARSETRPPRSHHEEARRDEKLSRMRRDDRPHVPDAGFETFRIEVGETHGVKPGNIVGAIANEAGLDSKNIGRVDIRDDYSLVDLPDGMPAEIFKHLKKVWVSGQQLRITRGGDEPDRGKPHLGKPPSFKPRSHTPGGFDKAKRHDAKKRPR
jgi:ATP-dependent RNA helicase DeaD